MTRKNGARTATDTAKQSVQQAAEAVAPYAATARDQCTHMAHEALERFRPMVSDMAANAQVAYGAHVEPQVRKVRQAVPDELDRTASGVARRAREAAAYAAPRVLGAAAATKAAAVATKAAAGPVTRQTAARGTAALSALRGEVSPAEIDRLARRRHRRAVVGRTVKRTAVVGALGAAAVAVWRWWDRQVNPDWMVEPRRPRNPAATPPPPGSSTTPSTWTARPASTAPTPTGTRTPRPARRRRTWTPRAAARPARRRASPRTPAARTTNARTTSDGE